MRQNKRQKQWNCPHGGPNRTAGQKGGETEVPRQHPSEAHRRPRPATSRSGGGGGAQVAPVTGRSPRWWARGGDGRPGQGGGAARRALRACERMLPSATAMRGRARALPEAPFRVGQRVGVLNAGRGPQIGTVQFVGTLQGHDGAWVGVEWDSGDGHDGSVNGVRYFETRRALSGSFVRPRSLSAGVSLLEALSLRYRAAAASESEQGATRLLSLVWCHSAPYSCPCKAAKCQQLMAPMHDGLLFSLRFGV